MSDEVDTMSGEELAAEFYTEVLGEAKPSGYDMALPTENWRWRWDSNQRGCGWHPVPLDGNQMMKGVRAMAERGYAKEGRTFLDGSGFVCFWSKDGVGTYASNDKEEIATARAAVKAMRAERADAIAEADSRAEYEHRRATEEARQDANPGEYRRGDWL